MNIEEKETFQSDNVNFKKINNPIKNLLINKGLIEILEKFSSHPNDDVRCLIENFIDDLKEKK